MRNVLITLLGLCGACCAVIGQTSVPALQSLAPAAWSGVSRVEADPQVVGISNALQAAGFAYSANGSQSLLAGALLFRTGDLAPYEHNLKTCRLVSDGAVFTGWTTLVAAGAVFPAYTTHATNGNEVGTTFVAWTLSTGQIVIDSRQLAEDYPPVPGAVDSVTVQLFAVNQSYLSSMLRAALALWAGQGSVTFQNASPPQLPLVMIQQASHFPNTLTLNLMNYGAGSEPLTVIVERFLTTDQTATPVVVVQPTTVPSGPSTVQIAVGAFEGAIIYVQDSSGNRDQAYLGRAFQFFTDQSTGGTSSVVFNTTGCSSGGANSPGALLLAPGCASLSGQVQQYTGIYLPVGSYVGQVVPLATDGIAGIEFYAKSPTPFRVEVETTDVVDGDYYGINLPASPEWTEIDVQFTALSQRGFGQSVPFIPDNTLNLSWLVPANVNPPNAAPQPFSMAVDSVALIPVAAVTAPPSGSPQTISFGPLANQVLGAGPLTLGAAASSGLPVSFVSTTVAVCTISAGADVALISVGTCTVTASQAGDATYAAATSITQTFAVLGAAQTNTVTIKVSPSSAQLGSLFKLTANVQDQNGNPVTKGSVIFYDGSAVLGTVQVVTTGSGGGTIGTAVLNTILVPLGPNNLTAIYAVGGAISTSQPAVATVTGQYPSTIRLTSSGSAGDYTITGIVVGGELAAPTGSVSFTDITTGLVPGSAALGTSTLAQTFVSAPQSTGFSGPLVDVLVDLNGDGIPDLLMGDGNQITLAIGVGDGTFRAPSIILPGAAVEKGIAVGDFNGDGKLDLAVISGGSLFVLLGNGDGIFSTLAYYDSGGLSELATGDFNGDGILDLVLLNSAGTVDLLLGNGDGTFKKPAQYPVSSPLSLVAGDVNGDGLLDVLVGTAPKNVSVFLGNADGTLHAGTTYTTQYEPGNMTLADFRGIGKLDLATVFNQCCEGTNTNLNLMLGNGDGTFQAEQTVLTGTNYSGLAAVDFNGDHKLDLVVSDYGFPQANVLLGNGDGTFQSAITYSAGVGPITPAVADLNDDGWPDFIVPNYNDGNADVYLNHVTQTATATLTGVILPGTGTHSVIANYSGDPNYSSSISNTLQLAASLVTPMMSLSALPGATVASGQSLSVNVTLTGPLSFVPAPSGNVSYSIDGGAAQPATLTGGTVAISLGQLSVGNHSVAVSYGGDEYYTSLARQSLTLNVTPGSVTTSIPGLFNTGVDGKGALLPGGATDPHYTLTVSADHANPGPAAIVVTPGTETTWIAEGPNSMWIAPTFNGDLTAPVGLYIYRTTFTLNGSDDPSTTVITGKWSTDNTGVNILVNGTSTSLTNSVEFGAFTPFTITSGFVSGLNTLDFEVMNTPGELNLNPTGLRVELAGTVETTTGVTTPTITWPTPAPITYGTQLSSTQLDASFGGVAGTPAYNPPAGTELSAGVHTLSVTFTPTDLATYTTATASVQLTVNPAVLTVTANNVTMNYGGPIPLLTYGISGYVNGDGSGVVSGTATLATTATAASPVVAGGYPITFATENLTASNYTFLYVLGVLTVDQVPQTITFNPNTPVTYGLAPIALNATGGASGSPVTFTYVSGPGSLSGANNSTLTVTGAGNIAVMACQSGSTNYVAANCVTKTIVVNPAVLTVTAASLSMPYGGPVPTLTYSISGYVNGDGSGVVGGTATLATAATAASPVVADGYPINFATENLTASNYTFVYLPGTLTVTQDSVNIGLISSVASIPAGSTFTLTATVQSTSNSSPPGTVTFFNGARILGTASIVNGVATFSTTLFTLGTNTLTASYPGSQDYAAGTSNPVTETVLPALTMTLLSTSINPAPIGTSVTFTTAVSSLAGVPSGGVSFFDGPNLIGMGTLLSGVATFSTNTLAVGSHDITAVYAGSSAFAVSTSNSVVEQVSDFTISAAPGLRSVYTGEAAFYTITVTSSSGFNLPVALGCTNLPANTTCSFSPASVVVGPGNATLLLQTTAPSRATTASDVSGGYRVAALAGLLFLLIPGRLRRSRKGWPMFLVILTVLVGGAAVIGCIRPISLSGGTPTGAQSITVTGTATNGSQILIHQTTVTLNVKSLF